AGQGGQCKIWDAHTGKEITSPIVHHYRIVEAGFDGQGRTHLAYWPGSVQTYDKAGTYVQTANDMLGSRDWQARFSAGGGFLASVGEGGVVRVWDVGSRQPVTPVLRHGASVAAVAFVAGGRLLLTGCSDGTVRVWDLAMANSPTWSKDLG